MNPTVRRNRRIDFKLDQRPNWSPCPAVSVRFKSIGRKQIAVTDRAMDDNVIVRDEVK